MLDSTAGKINTTCRAAYRYHLSIDFFALVLLPCLVSLTSLLTPLPPPQEKESLLEEKSETRSLLDELGRELQQTKGDLGEQRKLGADLMTQLEVRTFLWQTNSTMARLELTPSLPPSLPPSPGSQTIPGAAG